MRYPRLLTVLFACIAVVLLTARCGGGQPTHHATAHVTAHATTSDLPTLVQTVTGPGGQLFYKVRLPDGQLVTQQHNPNLAIPPAGAARPQSSQTGSTVEQYDSVNVNTIPRAAHYVAGYVDGAWRTYFQLKGHFPVVVGIVVRTSDGADCLDMEPGNPGPSNAGPWARWQLTQGNSRPCEYSMLSWMPAIRSSLAANHVPACTSSTQTRCVRLWDANWTFSRHLDAGYACTQWTDHAGGINLDESTCASWFYSAAPPPRPKPVAQPWSSAEVQIQGSRPNATVTVHVAHGHWTAKGGRVHSLPFNSAPLGK